MLLSEWLSHGLAEEQEGTYTPFLCFCIKPAQPLLLKIFIGLGGEGNEDGRETHHTHTHTRTHENKSKMQEGTSEVGTGTKIPAQSLQIFSHQTTTLCMPCPHLWTANKATAGDLGWCRGGLSDGQGRCKLIHRLIKAISKSIRDLTSRQYIVVPLWWKWHVNSN